MALELMENLKWPYSNNQSFAGTIRLGPEQFSVRTCLCGCWRILTAWHVDAKKGQPKNKEENFTCFFLFFFFF